MGKSQVKGVPMYDIKSDLRNKFLTASLQVVIIQTPPKHFWRVTKFGIRYFNDGWTINPKLIKYHTDFYPEWIDNDKEYLDVEENQKTFVRMNFNYGYANSKTEYFAMIRVWKSMSFI